MWTRTLKFIGLLTALAAIIILVVVLRARREPGQQNRIAIGAVYPLSGPTASAGKASLNGLMMAAEDINKNGLLDPAWLEIVPEDGKGEPTVSATAFESLIARSQIRFCFTLHSNVSLALIPKAKERDIFLLCEATHPNISNQGPLIFRHAPTTNQEADLILQHARENSRTRISILYQGDDYGQALKQNFSDLVSTMNDLQITGIEQFDKTATEFQTVITKLAAASPDTLIIAGSGKPVGSILKQCRELGLRISLYTTTGYSITPDAATVAGDAAKGAYTLVFTYEDSPQFKAFSERYQARFGSTPASTAILDYASLQILAHGLAISKSRTPMDVSAAIRQAKSLDVETGKVQIRPTGDILSPIRIKEL